MNKKKKNSMWQRRGTGLIAVIWAAMFLTIACGNAGELSVNCAAGDIIVFGRYEQDGKEENGPEPVEWLVLEAGEGKALLVSRYCLDTRPFHGSNIPIQWDSCDLRKWMNTEMIANLFTEEEQELVLKTALEARKNPRYSTWPGRDTVDRLFLLSYEEVEQYFPEPEDRLGIATRYARNRRAYVNRENGASGWWLRTTGHSADDECRVSTEGKFVNYDVNYEVDTVRPALWVRTGE